MPKMETELTAQDELDIVNRYQAGEGLVDLAKAYKRRFYTIKSIVESANVMPRRTATANTPIELRLHDALKSFGVGFTTQVRLVKRYVVDIKINQAPVVIEADGMWHRVGNSSRDEIRDTEHRAAGYQVFRFTGSEINADARSCIQHVIDSCKLTADGDPVYDIRTSFKGKDHPRWKGGLSRLNCENCGVQFEGRSNRKFCSKDCHYAHTRATGSRKGKPKSVEHRAKIAEANRRRTQSAETRAKISAARMGKPTTKGRPVSDETKAKISASLMGHTESAETRAKKSVAMRGNTNARRKDQIVIEPDLA